MKRVKVSTKEITGWNYIHVTLNMDTPCAQCSAKPNDLYYRKTKVPNVMEYSCAECARKP